MRKNHSLTSSLISQIESIICGLSINFLLLFSLLKEFQNGFDEFIKFSQTCSIYKILITIDKIGSIDVFFELGHGIVVGHCLLPPLYCQLQAFSNFKCEIRLATLHLLEQRLNFITNLLPLLSPPFIILNYGIFPFIIPLLHIGYHCIQLPSKSSSVHLYQSNYSIPKIKILKWFDLQKCLAIYHWKHALQKLNLVNYQVTKIMNSRFFYSNVREYLAKYRTKTREKRINFMNYLRLQRQRIIERERQKLFKRIVFWSIFLGGSFLVYDELYRKKVEINKMISKLDNFYPTIMVKQSLKQSVNCVTLTPKTLDELANIISLAYRYHYKVIVRMDEVTKREKIIISQKFDNKCLFINLSSLSKIQVDSINNTLYAESGATCSAVNATLEINGYAPIFPQQFQKQTIYDVIINNLPLNNGEFSKSTISMELLSASGKNFRSAGETNRYGQIPSLNSLFIGTGGIFALPTAANIRILRKQKEILSEEHFKIDIKDANEQVISLRKLNHVNSQYIELQIGNQFDSNSKEYDLFVTCKERFPIIKQKLAVCSTIAQQNGIPIQQTFNSPKNANFNLFFSVNHKIFEEFLLRFGRQLPYQYKNGLLKVAITDAQNHEQYISVINEVTNNNGALVWCDIPEILLRIKPSIDSSQVGAELMRKIVEVREGLDHRNVLYSHSRYQDYFAKGLFRKLTEYFW